ncbi:putative disease resistance protein [Drosera capensis]
MGSHEEISSTLKSSSSSYSSTASLTMKANTIASIHIISSSSAASFTRIIGDQIQYPQALTFYRGHNYVRYKAATMKRTFWDFFGLQLDEELQEMRSKADVLFARATDITVKVVAAELTGCKRKNEVENWLQNVENVKVKYQCIEDQVRGGASSSRTVPNVPKEVAKITKEINGLLQHRLPEELTFCGDAFSNVPFVTGSLKGHLFGENLKRILSWLDDDVATIGIHGAGGIGKTTLVTHVQKRLCEKFNNDGGSRNVYFVTISHGLTISGLQFKIANQLGLMIEREDVMKAAAMIYDTFMRRKYSVLILDDLWESFRPRDVGLPVGEGCFKLLLTTRNSRVCNEINKEKSRIIAVKCLSDDESWDLFREKLGDSAILFQDIARKVAKKCSGLPLALEHIAISMRAADTVEEWRSVLADMSSMMHVVVQDKVVPLLRISYDRLRDQQLKDCFLYCSLFPEDHRFDSFTLVNLWIREGLLDGIQNGERQTDKGFTIFKELINLSLLKADDNNYGSGGMMHDLVREMAVKVGKEKGFLIRAGEMMRVIPGEQEWNEDLCKVSLMDNDIGSISPDVAPRCPNLSTLLLSGNCFLTSISSLFFSLMGGLCVLDLSCAPIEKLPDSISNLKNLTALLLHQCIGLNYVPSLSMLGKLREMDISCCTELRDLPHGMEGLVNLKFLDCRGCPVPVSGILSGLSHLEELRIGDSSEAKGQDLMKLMHLKRLTCRIRNVSEFNEYVTSQCFESLHQYGLTVGPALSTVDRYFSGVERYVAFVDCPFEEDFPIVPGNVEGLSLEMCSGVEYLVSSASPDSTLIPLKTLGNLVELDLKGLENFKGLVKPGVALPSGSLSNLVHLSIVECDGIKKLFTSSMARGNLQNLQDLEIAHCRRLEEVIGGSDSDNDDDDQDDNDEVEYCYEPFVLPREEEIVGERASIYFPGTKFGLILQRLPHFKRIHPEGNMIGKIGNKQKFLTTTGMMLRMARARLAASGMVKYCI